MRLFFGIAARFLKSNRAQTAFIILGIGVGISVQIFIGCLIQGLSKGLVEKTIGGTSQITVTSESGGAFSLATELLDKVKNADGRIWHVSPALDGYVLISSGEEAVPFLLRGFDMEKADEIYKFSGSLASGELPENKNDILIGLNAAQKYGISVGDSVSIAASGSADYRTYRVSGVFDLGVEQPNSGWIISVLGTAQELFGLEGAASSIETQLSPDEVFFADEAAVRVSEALGEGFAVKNWKAQNGQLLSGLRGQSISSLMIQVFVVISVVLGISSVLAITVMQKSRQIGILKAMGIKNRGASMIFLFQGLILGVFGAVAGIILGLLLLAAFTAFALNPDKTPVVEVYISPGFIALSGAIAVLACAAASLIPARKSARLDPIDIIRNN